MANSYSVRSGMSTEKYQLVGTSLELLCLMLLEDFLVLRSAMRFFTVKTFPWIAISLVAVLVVSLVALFVTTPIGRILTFLRRWSQLTNKHSFRVLRASPLRLPWTPMEMFTLVRMRSGTFVVP